MVVEFENLPGIIKLVDDGNLGISNASEAPKNLVLGTASKGRGDRPVRVLRSQEATAEFGRPGTLLRGMFDTRQGGAENILLFRIGASPARLDGVGDSTGSAGFTIITSELGDEAGASVSVFYEDATGRLVLFNAAGALIFDNNPGDPNARVNINEVIVEGQKAPGGGPDIGGISAPVNLEDVPVTGTTFTPGDDCLNPSRMQLWEKLDEAYQLLENADFDIVSPVNAYLDDKNSVDQGLGATTVTLPGVNTYPLPGSPEDALTKVFVEEFEGERHYFWDTDGDGAAEIWPLKGSATAVTKIDGSALTLADFHEVNFAYQLANFLFRTATNNVDVTGTIGVNPPNSFGLKGISQWIGTPPRLQLNDDGSSNVAGPADNGTGLLGNKFMAGRFGYRNSSGGGGFIATDSGFIDGVEEKDDNDHFIDIGKHISVVAQWATLSTPFDLQGFGLNLNLAGYYAGFYSTLPANSAPTNKVIDNVSLNFDISNANHDRLAFSRYVTAAVKAKGTVVVDAPTAARRDSDFQRLTTMRITKAAVDALRSFGDPFIGEGITGQQIAALQTVEEGALNKLVKAGFLNRYDLNIIVTPQMQVLGEVILEVTLVPAFELRRITLRIQLAAQ